MLNHALDGVCAPPTLCVVDRSSAPEPRQAIRPSSAAGRFAAAGFSTPAPPPVNAFFPAPPPFIAFFWVLTGDVVLTSAIAASAASAASSAPQGPTHTELHAQTYSLYAVLGPFGQRPKVKYAFWLFTKEVSA